MVSKETLATFVRGCFKTEITGAAVDKLKDTEKIKEILMLH